MVDEIKKKDYLEEILQNHYKDQSIKITNLEVKPGISPGENYGSILLKAHIKWRKGESQDGEENLVIKTLPLHSVFVDPDDLFFNEINYYNSILPLYKSILKSRGIEYTNKIAPEYIHTKGFNYVILEDLSPLGYCLGNRQEGGGFDEAFLVLCALARNQAISISIFRKNSEFFNEKLRTVLWNDKNIIQRSFVHPFNEQIQLCEKWPEFQQFKGRISSLTCDQFVNITNSATLKSICQGDCWMNNALFRYENNKPVDVCLIDYQIIFWGPMVYDVLYFLYSSTNPQILEDNKQQLIDLYIDEFLKWMNILGEDLGEYTKENILKDFKQMEYIGVIIVMSILYIIISDPKDSANMNQKTLINIKNSQFFKEKLIKHLEIFIKENIL